MQKTLKPQVISLLMLTISSRITFGQVPQLINYQGVLLDPATGEPISDGTHEVIFSIYNRPISGSALWTETREVETQNGLYSTLLGSTTPLTAIILSGWEKYLGIKLGKDPEMMPRKRIVSVAYALTSASVIGTNNVFPSDGNVGIGTENPDEKLFVNGNVKVSGQLLPEGGIVTPSNITIKSEGNNILVIAGGSKITVDPQGEFQ